MPLLFYLMKKPELTNHEHVLFGKNGKLPESFLKRRAAFEARKKELGITKDVDEVPDPETEEGEEEEVKESKEDPEADNTFEDLPEDTKFPYHFGAGNYFLSNGEKVRGKKAAEQAQAQLDA